MYFIIQTQPFKETIDFRFMQTRKINTVLSRGKVFGEQVFLDTVGVEAIFR